MQWTKEVKFVRMAYVKKQAEKIPEICIRILAYAFMEKVHSHAYIDLPLFLSPPAKPNLIAICGCNEPREGSFKEI